MMKAAIALLKQQIYALNFRLVQKFPEATALFAALVAFIIYLITVDSSVSYWDCPEYVLTASTLQIGHPPGNPIWTLAMRMATIPFPSSAHALVINICSGLLMALAVFFLARIIYYFALWVGRGSKVACAIAASGASLCFAVLDSTWFSAVEAEVYAFSTFLTAFTIWLMIRRGLAKTQAARTRLTILIAYVLGLSLGVHQLNLLCLPVLALMFAFQTQPSEIPATSKETQDRETGWLHRLLKSTSARGWIALLISFLITGLILGGLMPGTIEWAAAIERLFVNKFGLPYFSGVIVYTVLFGLSFVATVWVISKGRRESVYILLFNFLWVSGIFLFKSHFVIALLLSIVCSSLMVVVFKASRKLLLTTVWCIGMVWLGYSAVAILLIRGYASPPVNEASPTDIFALQRYIAREQYGSKPLFYGPTPFSRPVLIEDYDCETGEAVYSRYLLKKKNPRYYTVFPSPRLNHRSGMLSHADSLENHKVEENIHGYILSDYAFSRVTTPELDMWFPRITSSASNMLDSYETWAGMSRENMSQVEISTVIDTLGNFTGKLNPEGERKKETSLKPTYLQNLRYFISYQVYYMYLRYLLWNFVGRQNDIHSTGEIDHGNFITGFPAVDNLMLGKQSLMPPSASRDNPGRHTYFALPFLLGIAGIVFLFRTGKRGRQVMAIITVLFLMTGVAIVFYLNQSPGEPRERDYAFIGSYMAYCIWIAFGFLWGGEACKRIFHSHKAGILTTSFLAAGIFLLLTIENFPDHNRNGRFHTRDFTLNMLAGKERDIIFSYGDNYTFPLWYAQEVENVAPEAAVIDLAYLAMPEYVVNLLKQGEKGVKLTARPSDIIFGAYTYATIAKDADTVPVALIDVLRELYSQKDGNPVVRHTLATLPGKTRADTLTINLRSLAGSSGLLPFKTLMILDIIATNLEQPEPRPVSFLTQIRREVSKPFEGALLPEAFSDTYAPDMNRDEYFVRLKRSASAIDSVSDSNAGRRPYIDPVIEEQVRRQRGAYVRVAKALAHEGYAEEAKKLMLSFSRLYPATEPGRIGVADSTFNATIEASRLLLQLSETSVAPDSTVYLNTPVLQAERNLMLSEAEELLRRSQKEPAAWFDYYKSLPAHRRGAVSNSSRRLIKDIPAIETLLNKLDSMKNLQSRGSDP